MERMALATIAMLMISTQCHANNVLSGHVEERGGSASRLARPALPIKDSLSSVGGQQKGHLDKQPQIFNSLDKGSFDFSASPKKTEASKTVTSPDDESQSKMGIAWEQWHKRFQNRLYEMWERYGDIPGEATIDITVTRSGKVDFAMSNFYVRHDEVMSAAQSNLFHNRVEQALSQLKHSDVLSFPLGSSRESITVSTKIAHSEQDDGITGFSWKKDDIEQVHRR